jgi:lysophosphatidic acid phosphatase type 6
MRKEGIVLQHVLVFHRHGDRTPVLPHIGGNLQWTEEEQSFWTSRIATEEQLSELQKANKVVGTHPLEPPHGPPSHGGIFPCGQLTQKGVEEMKKKGKQLKNRYGHLLQEENPQQIYIQSTNIRRTIQSVQCLLHGMFGEELLDSKNMYHIHTNPENKLAPRHPIRIFHDLESVVYQDLDQYEEKQKIQTLGHHLRQVLDLPKDKNVPWTSIRDMLTCRRAHDLAFPEGITNEMFDIIHAYDAWLWHRVYDKNKRSFCFDSFQNGVQEVYQHLKSRMEQETSSIPFSFFSAHDNSLVALMNALELQVGNRVPEYGTMLIFEVYQDIINTHQKYIRVLYDIPVEEEKEEELFFNGYEHSSLCSFEHFEKIVHQFLQKTNPSSLPMR